MSMTSEKRSKIRRADPYFERESKRYEQPLPSREYVLQILEAQGCPVVFDTLCDLLGIMPDEYGAFSRRLGAMERDGTLLRNRRDAYILPERASLIKGVVDGHPDGFGFLRRDDGEPDIFLDRYQMVKVLHGDRVLVRITGQDRKGRQEGAIVEVTERSNKQLVGRLFTEHGLAFVCPENRRISQNILIPPEKKSKSTSKPKLKDGQIVMVELVEPPSRYTQPVGRIIDVLGDYMDPGMEVEIALRKYDLPVEFSDEVQAESNKIPPIVEPEAWRDDPLREDLRHLPLVTIDGETARDFDDAVYCEPIESSSGLFSRKKSAPAWRLIVAIADVSHYVKPGTELDESAQQRGTSVYFPRRVIPMLPESLSNGVCSLNPDVDRLTMVCDLRILETGEIQEYRFYPAVIRSHARLTYEQVWQWVCGQDEPQEQKHKAVLPHLYSLYTLYQLLAEQRKKRGAIDFETLETQMLFDEQDKISSIVPVVRNKAHCIIEECMLAANVCAANFLSEKKHTGLYRVHQGPTQEKLSDLRAFLAEFGLSIGGDDAPQAKDYSILLGQIKNRSDQHLLQTVMLRSLRQAVYSPDNTGHFGLAYDAYAHFTSPIRRYPDLLIHRAIKACLTSQIYSPKLSGDDWAQRGVICSEYERRADEATRDVESWLKCFFMQDRIGEFYEGSISGVTAFGIFVTLDMIYVEGLVHVSDLGADYFIFDKIRHQMLGERSAQRFRLGDRLRVKVVRADLETGKIDFMLAPVGQDEKTTGLMRKFSKGDKSKSSKSSKYSKSSKDPKRTRSKKSEIKPKPKSKSKSKPKSGSKVAAKAGSRPKKSKSKKK